MFYGLEQDYAESAILSWLNRLENEKLYSDIDEGIRNYFSLNNSCQKYTWVLFHYTCHLKDKLPSRRMLASLPGATCTTLKGMSTTCTNFRIFAHRAKHGLPDLLFTGTSSPQEVTSL